MIVFLYFVMVGVSTLVALSNWRQGMLLMLLAGALQDPVRKMMPGTPGWMVLAFLPILAAIILNAFLGAQNPWNALVRAYPRIRSRVQFFTFSLLLALLVLVFNYGLGAWKVGVIGLIGYLFPLFAIALGFVFARTKHDLLRFIVVYCTLTAVLLIGGLLENLDLYTDWRSLGTDALGTVWIRHVPGYIVQLTSGFYRSPDLLGWHAGLLVMLSLLMVAYSENLGKRTFWLGLVVWGATILLISGRNKMIFMPPVFVVVVGLAFMYKGNINKSIIVMIAALLSIVLFTVINQQLSLDQEYLDYIEVGTSSTTSRLKASGIDSLVGTYRQSGFFGEGLGSASTGSRYGEAVGIKTWQEGGPGKLLVELGVVGFLSIISFGIVLLSSFWWCLNTLPATTRDSMLFLGFLGIVAANTASFIVSHQAFGDPFLVTLAGFFVGVTLSAPRWVIRQDSARNSTRNNSEQRDK